MSDEWKAWQREHTAALEALQEAQRAYHRAAVGSGQSAPGSQQSAVERRSSLQAVDAARTRLDEVRARRPE
jgi:hypothetical protein